MAREREVKVTILGDSKSGQRALAQLDDKADKTDSKFAGLGNKLASFGKVAALGLGAAVVGVGAFLKSSVEAAEESRKVMAQTDAVIKSTGGVARVSAGDVDKLASSLSAMSGIDDEVIAGGQNLLLTFTNIRNEVGKGNDIFNQGTKAALNMSVALGTDMNSASILVGKALNDPIKGLTALGRAGIQFTEDQKKQIKTMVSVGDTLGAQKIILKELETQFGGSAAAAASPMERLKVVVGNLQEELGARLLPVIAKVAAFLADKLPAALDAVGRVAGPVFRELVGGFRAFIAAFKAGDGDVTSSGFAGVLERIGNAARSVVDFVVANWPRVQETIAAGVGQITAVVSVLAPILGTVLVGAFNALQVAVPIVVATVGALIGVLGNPVFQVVAAIIATTLIPAFVALGVAATISAAQNVAAWVTTQASAITSSLATYAALVKSGLQWIWMGVTALASAAKVAAAWVISMGPIALVVAAVVGAAVLIVRNWDWIKETVGNVVGAVGRFIGRAIGFFGDLASAVGEKVGEAVSWVAGLPGRIIRALGDVGGMLWDSGLAIMRGLADGIWAGLGRVLGAVKGVLQKARDFLPFSDAKVGPFRDLTKSGRSIPETLAEGVMSSSALSAAMRKMVAAAEPTALGKYLTFSALEGDWANDWLMDIPADQRDAAMRMGKEAARTGVVPGSGGGGTVINNYIGTLVGSDGMRELTEMLHSQLLQKQRRVPSLGLT